MWAPSPVLVGTHADGLHHCGTFCRECRRRAVKGGRSGRLCPWSWWAGRVVLDGDEQAFCYDAGKWALRGGCTGAGQPSPAWSLEAGAVAVNPLLWRGCEEPCARTREGQASRPGLVPCSRSWPRVFLWLSGMGGRVCGRAGGEVGRPQAELAVSWDPRSPLERDHSAGWGAVRGRLGLHTWAPCSEEHSWQKAGAAAERPGEGGGRQGGVCSGPPAGSGSGAHLSRP